MAEIKIWIKDNAYCEEALLKGAEVEVVESAYGKNDFILDFIQKEKFWEIMTNMNPDELKKENGKNWRALNGLAIIKELMKCGRISGKNGVEKVIGDANLIAKAGFNLQEVKEVAAGNKSIIDTETLSNHLGRIGEESCFETFYGFISELRNKKWLRGKTVAADAHEIIIQYGQKFENAGKVGNKIGYKLLTLQIIEKGNERIIGFALAPLQESERDMLLKVFEYLEEKVAPIKDIFKTIVLDRGYWGCEFLDRLKNGYGIDFVTRPRDTELKIYKEVIELIKTENYKYREFTEETNHQGKKKTIYIKVAKIDNKKLQIATDDYKTVLDVNVVVALEYEDSSFTKQKIDADTGKPIIWIYITSLPVKNPYTIRELYKRRWNIENEGFRELTQNWGLDELSTKKFNAIRARIAIILMLYNIEKLLEWRYPEDWQEEKKNLKKKGYKELFGGNAIIVYTYDGYCGVFSAKKYADLVGNYKEKNLKEKLKQLILEGKTTDELKKYLE